jgi:hypothetical protein
MSVNVIKIYAGGPHSWVILDDVMPKKDDFKELQNEESNDDEYLINEEDDSLKQFSNIYQ